MNQTKASQSLTLRLRDGSERTVLNAHLLSTPQEPQSRRKHARRSKKSAKRERHQEAFSDLPVPRHPWCSLEYAAEFTKLILNSPPPYTHNAQSLLAMRGIAAQGGGFAKKFLPITHPLLLERNARVVAWLESLILPYDSSPEVGFDSNFAQTCDDRSWAEIATGWSRVPPKKSDSRIMATKSTAQHTSSRSKLDAAPDSNKVVAHGNVNEQPKNSLQEKNQTSHKKTSEVKTNILPAAKHQDPSVRKSKEHSLATLQNSEYEACSGQGRSSVESCKQPDNLPHKPMNQGTFLRKKNVSIELDRLEQEAKKQSSCIGKVSMEDEENFENVNTEVWSIPTRVFGDRPQKRFANGQKWQAKGIKRDLNSDWRVRD